MKNKFIGVDIGGTKCAIVCSDENANIENKIIFKTENSGWKSNFERIVEAIKSICNNDKIKAIGISCGGPLDSNKGVILSPPNLIGWDNVHIVDLLNKEFSVPVFLQNDANACALAEWKYGAGKGTRNMIFLTFGTGMGAGLILNGMIYEGSSGMAGEIGHVRMNNFGPVGYGKEGSFEGFCSGGGIAQLAKSKVLERIQRGESGLFCMDLDQINAKVVGDAAENGDELALEIYEICGEYLGRGLSILIDIFNPDAIVLGSIFVRSKEIIRKAMYRTIKEEALIGSANLCRIIPAELGESLGDIAAITVAVIGMEKINDK